MDDEVTITEAASIKGITRAAIHKAIRQGRLPARWRDTATKALWNVARPENRPSPGVWMIQRSELDTWRPALDPVERGQRSGKARRQMKEIGNGQK